MRICSDCEIEKDENEFGTHKRKMRNGDTKVYPSIYCKKCVARNMKKWRQNNPDKVSKQNKKPKARKARENWLTNNKDKRQEYEKQYYLDNKDQFKKHAQSSKAKETKRIYKRNKRRNDPIFKLRDNLSNAILKALKKGKSDKAGQSILQYLNFTIEMLKRHLEKQFDSHMNWGNHGIYWHIDHIIPQSVLPYTSMDDDNFKICWALDNLRPLEAKQNMSDGVTRIRHKRN